MVECKFVHVGFGTVVQANRVVIIIPSETSSAKRYVEIARKIGKYDNAAMKRHRRSVIVMDDGSAIVSAISPITLMRRMNDIKHMLSSDNAEDVSAAEEPEEIDEEEEDFAEEGDEAEE